MPLTPNGQSVNSVLYPASSSQECTMTALAHTPQTVHLSVLRGPRTLVLSLACAVSLAVLVLALVGLVADDRQITGAAAWLKPVKFAVSIAVYCATLAWLLSLVQGHTRLVRVVAWTTGWALILEFVLLVTQVVRGTSSHFNTTTAFDGAVFNAMGGLITLVFLVGVVTAVLLLRQRGLPAVLASGIRGGIGVCLLGMAAAVLMLLNRSIQPSGGHTVGAPDGGPGLPLTGWSTQHGDLRIAHFVGLHALQVLPLVAWGLQRYATRLSTLAQVRLVRTATLSCAGVVALLAWQAERGLPLLAPDAAVLTAALAGAALGLGVAASVVGRDLRDAATRVPA
jgi:hypothetical protein